MKIAVNVSALQFAQSGFASAVSAALAEAGLEPRWLDLEITESLLMKNTRDAIAKLSVLRKLGVRIAIDDFGTGYSSLAYLHRLPFDTLKIDKSFVQEIGPDALEMSTGSDTAVIRAVASLAQSLNVAVVAEGVETDHQRQFLVRLGCSGMQGFHFGKPVPAPEAELYLRNDALLACQPPTPIVV